MNFILFSAGNREGVKLFSWQHNYFILYLDRDIYTKINPQWENLSYLDEKTLKFKIYLRARQVSKPSLIR
jgi:hypothetical protein